MNKFLLFVTVFLCFSVIFWNPFNTKDYIDVEFIEDSEITKSTMSIKHIVKSGETLERILKNNLASKEDTIKITNLNNKKHNFALLNLGQKLTMFFEKDFGDDDADWKLVNLLIPHGKENFFEIFLNEYDDFEVSYKTKYFTKNLIKVGDLINNSIYNTADKLNIPKQGLADVIKSLSFDIDFQREVKEGSKFDTIFEKYYTEQGEFSHFGNIIYASIDLGPRKVKVYKYTDKKGYSDYYDEKGNSIRKELLKTPISAARISSRFGSRKHPILGFTKMHRGVDFAAPAGTPIFAAGKGYVEEIGKKGAYGNYIRIKHNSEYSTAYAHLKKFAPRLKKGSIVKQGQIIAYVGSTGRSTGPHLHYEVLHKNKHVNPLNVKLKSGEKLHKGDMDSFTAFVNDIDELVDQNNQKTELKLEYVSNKIKEQL